jgi:hypothetical protein
MLVVAKGELDSRWVCRHHKTKVIKTSRNNNPSVIISKADTTEVQRLLAQQSQLSAQVRRSFMDAVSRIQDQIDVDQVAQLLRQGQTQQAIEQATQAVMGGYGSLGTAITHATITAGITAAQASPELGELGVSFGITNPGTIQFLQNYEMNLITGLSQDSLASVRAAIQAGVTAGRNPLDIARDIRDLIGLTPRQTQAVLNYRGYLENLDPAALARDLRDARFDPTIQSALDDQSSLSADYIDKVVARYQSRMLNYRADTISRTEALRAVNAGNHQLWNGAVNSGTLGADQVVRQWIYTRDGRTRPWHVSVPSLNPDGVGLNEPFDTELGPMMYPGDENGLPENSINCRCTVFYRVKPDLGKRDGPRYIAPMEKSNPYHEPAGSPIGGQFASSPTGKLPLPDTFAIPRAPNETEMRIHSRIENVPLNRALGTETTRQWERFNNGDHPPELISGYGDKPVAAKLSNGNYLIYDGHHRAELALKNGIMSLDMHVINVKDYAPGSDQKPSSGPSIDELFRELTKP